MKKTILSVAVLFFAGVSVTQAGVLQDTVSTPADTTQKYSYEYANEQDTVKQDTVKKEYTYTYGVEQDTVKQENPTDSTKKAEFNTTSAYNNQEAAGNNQAEEIKKEVKLEELPATVKQTLTADIFKEWIPAAAQHISAEGIEYYVIEVKKDSEVKTIKIGADGSVIK